MKINYKILPLAAAFLITAFFSTGFTTGSIIYLDEESGKALTDQIWAVQVEAEPGESGHLNQNFEAAYDPYDGEVIKATTEEVKKDSFGFIYDEQSQVKVVKGENYAGNYFNIEQVSAITGGTTKRHIDISSPWSGAYLYEDMVVKGITEIKEIFRMDNLGPGEKAVLTWHDLF